MKALKWLRKHLFIVLHPFFQWAAGVHAPWTHKKVTGVDYYQVFPHLKPGTIFVTRILGDLTTLYIPGFWTHAAIYSPTPNVVIDELVTQAEAPGVIQQDLVSFMLTKDFVVALEPNLPEPLKEKVMARASQIAAGLVGDSYDYEFESYEEDTTSFYCSKVVWYSYDKACAELGLPSLFVPENDLGELTVSPQSIANDKVHFTVIYKTSGAKI